MAPSSTSDIRQLSLDDWRAKDRRPIGGIGLNPRDFANRWHIQFQGVADDLDEAAAAVVELPSRAKYLLVRYAHDSGNGITVYRPATAARSSDLSNLIRYLGLPTAVVTWSAKRLAKPRTTRRQSNGSTKTSRRSRQLVAVGSGRRG